MKNPRIYLKNRKGINTILAALLMVVIVVVASVMVYAWSTGLLGTLLVNPNNNKEGPLYSDSQAFGSCTCGGNVTLYVRNGGTLGVTLTAYYITDSSGNTWQVLNWGTAGPTIAPNQVLPTNFYIGSTTGSTTCGPYTCTYTGTSGAGGFVAFNAGSYTVKVVTARNNPFSFTVSK